MLFLTRFISLIFALMLAPHLTLAKTVPATSIGHHAVFAMTNDPVNNKIIRYTRSADGRLINKTEISTHGKGSGGNIIDPLGSQNALLVFKHGKWLAAVNAGSNEISLFRILPNELKFSSKIASGGELPISISYFNNYIYVLNQGGKLSNPRISTFKLSSKGKLIALPEADHNLPLSQYAQLSVDPYGVVLALTDKGNQQILVFRHHLKGKIDPVPVIVPSNGKTPFGFTVDVIGHLTVAEAAAGAVSTYRLGMIKHGLKLVSASIPNHQKATCWIVQTRGGYTYTSNTASNTISAYKVWAETGKAKVINEVVGNGSSPTDLAVTSSNNFVYSLNPGDGSIHMFKINRFNGYLLDLGKVEAGLPRHAQGLAAT